ncbi:FIST signal transduction protein [Luteitalea sp.]|jgi:hypothetical protein|uniref:FIST signal transduction protein n=1 Tax=Luteitalea sp. TaxID=2004800 RepID=UPI0037CB0081
MTERLRTRRGSSHLPEADAALADLAAQIVQPDMRLALVFVSPRYDREALGRAIGAHFTCPVLACTTAGEIGADVGYASGGIVGASLASAELDVRTVFLPSLAEFVRAGGELPADVTAPPAGAARRFALLLLDGLSMLEEPVSALVNRQLGGVPVIGGAAGDGLDFRHTLVYHDGRFHEGAGILACVDTTLPFSSFMLQHFAPTDTKLVITEADVATRRVLEIDGEPAADRYARVVGLDTSRLSPQVFAAHPVMLRLGGRYYVRSIQRVNGDGSLSFFCAIDTGLVLTLARPTDLVTDLEAHLKAATSSLDNLSLILGFDCVLRRLELEQAGRLSSANAVLAPYPFLGFSTYGEQYNGLHMNHTMTGLALGG